MNLVFIGTMTFQAKQHQGPNVNLSIHYTFSVIVYTHSTGHLQAIIDAMQAQKQICCMSFALFYYQWEIIVCAVYWSESEICNDYLKRTHN